MCQDLSSQTLELSTEVIGLRNKLIELEQANAELRRKLSTCTSFGHDFIAGDDAKTSYYTGFPNYATLISVLKHTTKHVNRVKTKLSKEDEIFLALVKLKHNPAVEDLGYRFRISLSLVRKTFHVWLDALYCSLGGLIMWPTTDFMQLPDCFNNDRFRKVKCVIDCTEIFIQRPRGSKPELKLIQITRSTIL